MSFVPMGIGSLRPIIERTYRESETLQFLRELVTNSLEAGASIVEVGPHHEIGESQGIWRFMARDNGCGMSSDQMLSYLNNFGKGGKAIGGAHENFGIGSKTSLLPWNRAGMVVISYTEENQQGSMIKLMLDEDTGEYGLGELKEGRVVCAPFDDGFIDWSSLRPNWMVTGTIVFLLGNTGHESTYLEVCDTIDTPVTSHSSIWWAVEYLAKRYWSFDRGVFVTAYTFDRKPLPQQRGKAKGSNRLLKGGKANAEELAVHSGCVELPDKTKVWWFLKDKTTDRDSPAAGVRRAGVAALYKRELYDITTHLSSLKKFGLTGLTRKRTLLVFEPPILSDGFGVCPDGARSKLIMQSDTSSGVGLPWDVWAEWWRERLPDEIIQSMLEDQAANLSEIDSSWSERLKELFGNRWTRTRSYLSKRGKEEDGFEEGSESKRDTVTATPSRPNKEPSKPKEQDQLTLGNIGNTKRRVSRKRAMGDLPAVEWIEDGWSIGNALAASYTKPSKVYPAGIVELNWNHKIFVEVFQHWCSQYHNQAHIQKGIKEVIQAVYSRHITTTIAHAHSFQNSLVLDDLVSDVSLTCSLMGLYAQDGEIRMELSRCFSKPDKVAA